MPIGIKVLPTSSEKLRKSTKNFLTILTFSHRFFIYLCDFKQNHFFVFFTQGALGGRGRRGMSLKLSFDSTFGGFWWSNWGAFVLDFYGFGIYFCADADFGVAVTASPSGGFSQIFASGGVFCQGLFSTEGKLSISYVLRLWTLSVASPLAGWDADAKRSHLFRLLFIHIPLPWIIYR